jgi:isocitrate dehydrogenase kinase/phosphatase
MVVLNQIFLEVCHFDEPGRYCLVNQRSVTSPTVRIVVDSSATLDNSAFVFDVLGDYFVGFLHVNSLVWWAFFSKFTVLVKRNWRVIRMNDALGNTDFVIFLTESWSAMHNTST